MDLELPHSNHRMSSRPPSTQRGSLVEALDRFITERIRALAHEINAGAARIRRQSFDEVHKETANWMNLRTNFYPASARVVERW